MGNSVYFNIVSSIFLRRIDKESGKGKIKNRKEKENFQKSKTVKC